MNLKVVNRTVILSVLWPIFQSFGVWILLDQLFASPATDRGHASVFRADAAWHVTGLLERDHAFSRVREGDVNIGMLISVHDSANGQCTDLLSFGVAGAWVMEFAIDEVNARSDLLPNITLGFVQMDDCWNDLKALEVSMCLVGNGDDTFSGTTRLNDRQQNPFRSYEVIGVLGPLDSPMSMAVSQFLGAFQIPVMAFDATNDALSDKTEYPFFMRLAPPDIRQEKIQLEVCKYVTERNHLLMNILQFCVKNSTCSKNKSKHINCIWKKIICD